MDAGADPLRPARPEDGREDDKPKPTESQDDGYETSNSGEAARRKPSSAEGSPAPPADGSPPPDPPYDLLRYHQPDPDPDPDPEPYRHFEPAGAPALEAQYFPFPYGYKREELPYDMSQHHAHQQPAHHQPLHQHQHQHPHAHAHYAPPHHLKRDDDIYNGIKRECDDPYSFVEEEAMVALMQQPPPALLQPGDQHGHLLHPHQLLHTQPKKRGRKKKLKDENGMELKGDGVLEGVGAQVPRVVKERKKHDRFNGMSEEEVARRTLPDHLAENLDIIIIGINPGLFAAYKGHHYAGPGNHFWKCLYLSGLTREQMSADEDYKLLNFGIGFTNMVPRPTKGSADLTRREIKEGSAVLLEKLQTFRPKVAVFNGKLIYEVFSGKKDFCFGKQPDTVVGTNTYMWVMPSSSARCAQLPRAADKVPFYAALKKFRDYLNGLVAHLDEAELVFPDTTSRRPQEEMEIRRLTMEPEPGDTIILEDGTEVPLKKKRGRPKKVKLENGEVVPPAPRAPRQPRPPPALDAAGGDQPPKKKRGRPKKIRPEDQQFLMQQQSQHQGAGNALTLGMAAAQEQGYLPPHGGDFPQQLPSPGSLLYHHQQHQHQQLPESPVPYFQPQQQQPQPQPTPAGMESPLDVSGALAGLTRSYGSPGANAGGGGGTNPASGFCSSPRGVYASPVSQGYSPGGGTPGPAFPGSPGGGGGGAGYHSPAARGPFSGRSPLYAHSPAHQPYHHHHHLQNQQPSPAAQGRFSQSPHPHHPPPYARSPAPAPQTQTQPRPYSRSPVGGASTPFPAASPAGGGGYTPSPAHTPYSHRSSPAPAPRTPVYTDTHHFPHQVDAQPMLGGGSYGGAAELSQEIGAAISSPGPVSPGMAALDFEPPRDPDRAASPDLHPASTSDSSLSDYNKQPLSCEQAAGGAAGGGGDLSPGGVGSSPFGALYEPEPRLGYAHAHAHGHAHAHALPLHHAHSPPPPTSAPATHHDRYRNEHGNGMADSPRLDQMHQHPSMYPSNFNRSTPPSGAEGPFSPFRAGEHAPLTPQPPLTPHTPHTPHTPLHHQPGSPGEYSGAVKPKPQDVASKSLSGLESLVDQIPSIAEGPGGAAGTAPAGSPQVPPGEQAAGPAPVPALPEYAPALYGPYGAYGGAPYGNNGYGGPFVGYGGGWGAAVMRPAPGYLPDWQYGYGPSAYAPYNAPYYNGYAAPPPAHHQQAHYLSAPPLIDLHKNGEHSAGVPPVPSVPSVGFGGFC